MFAKSTNNAAVLLFYLIIFSSVATAEVAVAPVPWIPESGKTKTGNLTDGITFRGVPPQGEIYIYTVNGNLVRKIVCNNSAIVTKS